jgi:hypothetical protein
VKIKKIAQQMAVMHTVAVHLVIKDLIVFGETLCHKNQRRLNIMRR